MGAVISIDMIDNDWQVKALLAAMTYTDEKYYKEAKPKVDTSVKYFAKQKSNYKSKRKK